MVEEALRITDGINALTSVPGGPTEHQVRLWIKRKWLNAVRKPLGTGGTYPAFTQEERFVAVVIARLLRARITSRIAVPAARRAWGHPVGNHRVILGPGVSLLFTTKADGQP